MSERDWADEEERAEFCARVWQGIAVRLDAAAPGTRIRFAPREGLIWASPPSGTDPYILARCIAPLEWLEGGFDV